MELSSQTKQTMYDNAQLTSRIFELFFKNTPIIHFDYEIFEFNTSTQIIFGNNPDYVIRYLRKELYPTYQEMKLFLKTGIKYTFIGPSLTLPMGVSSLNPQKYIENINTFENMSRMYLAEYVEAENYLKLIGIGTKSSENSVQILVNFIEYLNSFITYFELEMHDKISEYKTENNSIYLPKLMDEVISVEDETIRNIKPPFPRMKKYTVMIDNRKIALTKREAQCLAMNYQNFSSKEISKELNISSRTVEQHIYNIKNKLGPAPKHLLRDAAIKITRLL